MFPHPHDALPLPPRPNLNQYKKLAKDLLKAAHSPDPTALHIWATTWIASLGRLSPNNSVIPSKVAASRSEAATQSRDLLLFNDHRTAQLENFAREHLHQATWERTHSSVPPSKARQYKSPTLTAAQFVLARAHGFESWPKLAKHIEATTRANSPVNHFEQAADAIVTGDTTTLANLLKKYPDLVRTHSTRRHQATLLHYTAANGIEDYRQKTPANIVQIARLLLDSGADVNAVADLYGGSTTLSLAATSLHPERAGVQNSLLQLLLDHSATIDIPNSPTALINICLANGRRQAAEFLAAHGARIDLEAAAGLGQLDVVRSFFAAAPTSNSTRRATTKPEEEKETKEQNLQKQRALIWACEYGRNLVVDFLLDQGVPIQSQANTGQTPLHWAVIGGQSDTIELLLVRGSDLEAKNTYGGTALGQALWSAAHADNPNQYLEIAALLKRHGAKSE